MLLNQCLAISLLPTRANQTSGELEEESRQVVVGERGSQLSQTSASRLFQRLLEENLEAEQEAEAEKRSAACQAIGRVEFAGFVVPSWLLLSGTFDDLHQIKSCWTSAGLRAPAGWRIETIGKWSGFLAQQVSQPRAALLLGMRS